MHRPTSATRGLRTVVLALLATALVMVPVRLRRDRATDLTLTARPMAGFDRTHAVEVRVRPRR